jgi:hypothetical protein
MLSFEAVPVCPRANYASMAANDSEALRWQPSFNFLTHGLKDYL